MNSYDVSDPTKDRNDRTPPAPEARGPEEPPALPQPDSKRKPVQILMTLSLGLILLAGAAAVAWQFFGEQMKKAGWFTALTGHARVDEASKHDEIYYCPMQQDYQCDKHGDPLFTLYSPELVSTQEEYLLALRAQGELSSSSFERIANGADRLVQAARRRLSLWDVTDAEIARLEKEGKARRELTIFSPV